MREQKPKKTFENGDRVRNKTINGYTVYDRYKKTYLETYRYAYSDRDRDRHRYRNRYRHRDRVRKKYKLQTFHKRTNTKQYEIRNRS